MFLLSAGYQKTAIGRWYLGDFASGLHLTPIAEKEFPCGDKLRTSSEFDRKMQAKDHDIFGRLDSAWSVNELTIGPDCDRRCEVHAVVNLYGKFIVGNRLRRPHRWWQLRVIKDCALREETVDMHSADGDTEVVLWSPGGRPRLEETHLGNLLNPGDATVSLHEVRKDGYGTGFRIVV